MLISCAPSVQTYDLTLYNSNDGNCDLSGESLDFYMNGEKVATVASGGNVTIKLPEGQYVTNVKITGTAEFYWQEDWIINVPVDSYSVFGCHDGTRPTETAWY